jgi:hypothetical protein
MIVSCNPAQETSSLPIQFSSERDPGGGSKDGPRPGKPGKKSGAKKAAARKASKKKKK